MVILQLRQLDVPPGQRLLLHDVSWAGFVDPPPNLALEIDITARTHPSTYAALGVPELWRGVGPKILIYQLQN